MGGEITMGPCRDTTNPWMRVEKEFGEMRLMGQGVLEALMGRGQQDSVLSLRRGSSMGHQQG